MRKYDHSKILERRRKTIGRGTYFYELLPEEEKVRMRESCNKYMKAHPEVNKRNYKKWYKNMKNPLYRKARAKYTRERYWRNKGLNK